MLLRDAEVPLDYEVEQDATGAPMGVVRLRLPEKLARTLVEEELPPFDRPVRFQVRRGRRGSLRADSLLELQELLDMPWMPDELEPPPAEVRRRPGGRATAWVRPGPGRGGRRPKR